MAKYARFASLRHQFIEPVPAGAAEFDPLEYRVSNDALVSRSWLPAFTDWSALPASPAVGLGLSAGAGLVDAALDVVVAGADAAGLLAAVLVALPVAVPVAVRLADASLVVVPIAAEPEADTSWPAVAPLVAAALSVD